MVQISNRRSTLVEPSRTRRKADARRRAILKAAASAFRKHGIAATGMREIAEAADLSPANLYYYFESKDELLYFCQDWSLDRMLEAARAVRRGGERPPEQLRQVIRAQLHCMLDELEGSAAHLEVDALSRTLRERIVAKRDRYESAVRRIVEDGIRSRDFARTDATLVTRAILGALNWTARWYRPEGEKTWAAVAATFSDYLVRGLIR
ncbi:TetR/AcrR family transcriptional regulator [bacterium]|nr:TetR/AcrR family transcriptional regulator [bacterium]